MSRTAESLSEEVLLLRAENRTFAEECRKLRDALKQAEKELAWWKKTFGPEADK